MPDVSDADWIETLRTERDAAKAEVSHARRRFVAALQAQYRAQCELNEALTSPPEESTDA